MRRIVERLEAVRRIGLEPDRQRRIHQARYAAFVREAALVTAQHLNEASSERRLALLTALVLEQEASLTDAGIIMFDKMLGNMFRRADHEHRERMVNRAKALDAATRTLLPMAKAMLAARASGADLLVAVEGSIGWQRLETLVDEAAATLMDTREDNLSEVIGRYPIVRRSHSVM
jgi:hypothetical protein